MQYRAFGKLDWNVSALGYGGLRFPVSGGDHRAVNEPEAIRLLRYAIDHGVNYVDTSYQYHGGRSEIVIGRALQDGYRERVKVATKLPIHLVESLDDCDRFLDEQLERLQMDSIDFYLLDGLELRHPQGSWARVCDLGVLDWLERRMADGRFHHLGFSFHGSFEAFRRIIGDYDNWTMCMILYNYMDEDYQAGRRGLEYAAEKGLAVAVMEPLRGGSLANNVPPSIQLLWGSAPRQRTPADWALQWVWNHPGVSVAVSGMSIMGQVRQNVASAAQSGPGTLSAEELSLIARVRDTYRGKAIIRCSKCRYCMPCPNGVNIPRIFELYNDAMLFENVPGGRIRYNNFLNEEETASSCVQCGQCVEHCPRRIDIPACLAEAHELLYEPCFALPLYVHAHELRNERRGP